MLRNKDNNNNRVHAIKNDVRCAKNARLPFNLFSTNVILMQKN